MRLGNRGHFGNHRYVECIADSTMVDLLEGRLCEAAAARVHDHLDSCTACRALMAGAAMALGPEPDDDEEPTRLSFAGVMRSDPPPSTALAVGTDIDNFHVIQHIAHGGMGEVYVAHDRSLDRQVALKVIKASLLASEKARKGFALEARATARLNHPNIVTIHAIGEHEGMPYVALELLDGITLRRHLHAVRPSAEEARHIGRAIAEALEAAHAAGVFHRDLKPSNVMLGSRQRVSVLDFGLAQLAEPSQAEDQESLLLRSMRLGGTPTYMAPEQWRREPSSGATDIWALGVVLHEMHLGERPFERMAPEATTLSADELRDRMRAIKGIVCAGNRIDTDALVEAGMSTGWAKLVAACLDPEPERRPTASEVIVALDDVALDGTALDDAPGDHEAPAAADEAMAPAKQTESRRAGWPWAAAILVGGLGVGLAVRGTSGSPAAVGSPSPPPTSRPALSTATPAKAPPLATASAPAAPATPRPAPAPPPRTSPPKAAPPPPPPPPPATGTTKDDPWNPMRYR